MHNNPRKSRSIQDFSDTPPGLGGSTLVSGGDDLKTPHRKIGTQNPTTPVFQEHRDEPSIPLSDERLVPGTWVVTPDREVCVIVGVSVMAYKDMKLDKEPSECFAINLRTGQPLVDGGMRVRVVEIISGAIYYKTISFA